MLDNLLQGNTVPLIDGYSARLLRIDDIPDIIEMLSDPLVTEYLYFAPAPPQVYEGYFRPIVEGNAAAKRDNRLPDNVVLVVRCNNTSEFVGNIGLTATVLCPGNFEIGFQIRRKFHGQGIATSAGRMLTQIAFEELDAHKICADVFQGNVASARVLQKLGYHKEGQLSAYYKTNCGFDDKVLYGLSRNQFFHDGVSLGPR